MLLSEYFMSYAQQLLFLCIYGLRAGAEVNKRTGLRKAIGIIHKVLVNCNSGGCKHGR